jgi:hypothetical protein
MPVRSRMRSHSAIAVEAEPARRGAAPADRVHLGVGQQFGGRQDLAVVELAQRLGIQRDLGDGEAREMGAGPRHRRHDGAGEGLEGGVRRRRQHAEADGSCHGSVPALSGFKYGLFRAGDS